MSFFKITLSDYLESFPIQIVLKTVQASNQCIIDKLDVALKEHKP